MQRDRGNVEQLHAGPLDRQLLGTQLARSVKNSTHAHTRAVNALAHEALARSQLLERFAHVCAAII